MRPRAPADCWPGPHGVRATNASLQILRDEATQEAMGVRAALGENRDAMELLDTNTKAEFEHMHMRAKSEFDHMKGVRVELDIGEQAATRGHAAPAACGTGGPARR